MNETGTITRQRYITAKRAARIASEWYDGDRSALYKFSCKPDGNFKSLTAEDFAAAYTEADRECCHAIYTEMGKNLRKDLHELKLFLIHKCPGNSDAMTEAIIRQCAWTDGYMCAMHHAGRQKRTIGN